MSEKIENIKLCIYGCFSTGKKNLMMRFLYDEFPGDNIEFGACFSENVYPRIKVNDCEIKVEVESVSYESSLEFGAFYLKGYDGFLLCFALDDLSTFQALPEIYDLILMKKDMEKPPIILVGTKSDIEESKRKVTKEQAEEYASQISCEYFEVSSLTTSNVKEAYQCIIQKTYDYLKSKLLEKEEKKKGKKKDSHQEKCLI